MARVKRGVTSRAKHKKVLKAVKGQWGRRKNTIRVAKQAMEKAMQYPITYQLIKDGRKNIVLNKPINIKTKITMVHGEKDEVVPISYSKKVLKIFPRAQKKMLVVKNGDHSLSSKKWLKIISKELKEML